MSVLQYEYWIGFVVKSRCLLLKRDLSALKRLYPLEYCVHITAITVRFMKLFFVGLTDNRFSRLIFHMYSGRDYVLPSSDNSDIFIGMNYLKYSQKKLYVYRFIWEIRFGNCTKKTYHFFYDSTKGWFSEQFFFLVGERWLFTGWWTSRRSKYSSLLHFDVFTHVKMANRNVKRLSYFSSGLKIRAPFFSFQIHSHFFI